VSYATVMDDFVRQGAQGFIIPTLDPIKWGGYERRMLHGRMAPVRSAEYGIPIFGVWSSGESQLTDRYGRVIARAGFPGQGEIIAGSFNLAEPGHIPPDRPLAFGAMLGTAAFIAHSILGRFMKFKGPADKSNPKFGNSHSPATIPPT